MPRWPSTSSEITAFAWCNAFRGTCPGYAQVPVPAVRTEVTHIYPGVPGNAVENTHVALAFASEEDESCPHCGTRREISEQERRQYQEFIAGEIAAPIPVPVPAGSVSAEDYAKLQARLDALEAERQVA